MTHRLSKRAKRADPFIAMDVLARAKALEAAGRSIVHMETGQPGAPVPEPRLGGNAGRELYGIYACTRWCGHPRSIAPATRCRR